MNKLFVSEVYRELMMFNHAWTYHNRRLTVLSEAGHMRNWMRCIQEARPFMDKGFLCTGRVGQ